MASGATTGGETAPAGHLQAVSRLAPLFAPLRIRSLTLPNRLVMAPMTRGRSPGGVPNDQVAAYYARRAAAEVGLIVSEGALIERPAASNHPSVPRFCGEDALAGWQRVLEAVLAAGGRMAPQLWHVGAFFDPRFPTPAAPLIDSPSGYASASERLGEPLRESDIADIVAAFARAAGAAQRLGFDAIELHGAHGYLFDQFFWSATNRRRDRYGGSALEERARFAAEVMRAVRAEVGEEMAISFRISQWKQQDYSVRLAESPRELERWLTPLADAGADIIHCSQRRFWEPEFEGSPLNLAGWVKKVTGLATIAVGSVGLIEDGAGGHVAVADLDALRDLPERLDRGEFDLVALGRSLLAMPAWVEQLQQGEGKRSPLTAETFAELY